MNSRTRAIRKVRTFNRFYTAIIGVLDRNFLDSPFSLTEIRVMGEIDSIPGNSARVIKNSLYLDEGYLSRTIDKLVRQGLVIRKKSGSDARKYILSLSRKGNVSLSKVDVRSQESIASLIHGLNAGDLKRLLEAMQTITALLDSKKADLGS